MRLQYQQIMFNSNLCYLGPLIDTKFHNPKEVEEGDFDNPFLNHEREKLFKKYIYIKKDVANN